MCSANQPKKTNRKAERFANERGIAILVAISVVAVLLTAGLALNQRIRGSVAGSVQARDKLILTEMAASGIQAATILLINDRKENETDTLQEDWADSEKVSEMVALAAFETGSVEVKIIDERSKIQVNALVQFPEGQQYHASQRFLWERLLSRVFSLFELLPEMSEATEDTNPNMIIDSLKDWMDDGDDEAITGLSGAESDYYQDLDPPYSCKNGPIDHLGEIALVQGVTPILFNGAGGVGGLSSVVTVHGESPAGDGKFTFDGKINISTADEVVLSALLPAEHTDLAEAMVDYRVEKADEIFTNKITDPQWYKNVPGLGDVTIDDGLITVASDLFRIVSKATKNNRSLTIETVVQREKEEESGRWTCKTLIWDSE
jgi:general secretion pathway protein K